MTQVMEGVRVVEVASWTYVPVAGAVLAEWGADVIKIEHPESGDPQRGLITSGLVPAGPGGINHMMELPNRGKRSVGLDLRSEEGHELLLRMAARADVFLTNFRPQARKKLRIDVDDVRAVNPNVIYVRGSGHGQRGPESEQGGTTDVRSGRGAVRRTSSAIPTTGATRSLNPDPGTATSSGG